jgi:hypothetical protein
MIVTPALADQLDALHTEYAVAVNEAVAADDLARVERLARAHDRAASALVARHEGTVRVLPTDGRRSRRTGLRRLTRWGRGSHAA